MSAAGWGTADPWDKHLSPVMSNNSNNGGWGLVAPSPLLNHKPSRTLSRKDSWATFKPKQQQPSSIANGSGLKAVILEEEAYDTYDDQDYATRDQMSYCKQWICRDKCDGWCGNEHPPDDVKQVMVPGPFALDIVTSLPKADVILASLVAYRSRRHQGLCKVLGVTKIHPSADSKLRETPDNEEKLAILHQAQVDYLVSGMLDMQSMSKDEMTKAQSHLRDLLGKLGVSM